MPERSSVITLSGHFMLINGHDYVRGWLEAKGYVTATHR